jgi:hypothetical protein
VSKQQDALTALATGGITERAEAVRLLAVIGDSEVLDALLTAALQDRSPGVRLAAASAAADVLARYRLPPHFGDLGNAQRRAIEGQLRAIDPGRNNGLFQVLACLGDPALVRRLGRGVRDPRVDVRTGALVGLERLASSGSVNGLPAVVSTFRELLGERRLRSDALLELARLSWRVGLWQLRPEVEALAGRVEERWLAPLDELLATYPSQLEAGHLLGCWADQGLDCGEQRQRTGPPTYLIVLPERAVLIEAEGSSTAPPWSLEPEGLACVALSEDPLPVRLLRGWYAGQESCEVLQVGPRSFGRTAEKDLPQQLDLLSLELVEPEEARALLALLEPGLSERAAGSYVRAVLSLMARDPEPAAERLEALVAAKRPRPEVYWHQARLRELEGDAKGARAALESYLAAAGRKSPFVERARSAVGQG